ncbi:MAG: protein kinase domain-containing protein, partial [Myxococcaceae bacterium]
MPCEICDVQRTAQSPLARMLTERATGEPPDPVVGTVLGSYRVVRHLGRGGMGTVYLAEHVEIQSKVALKLLHPHLARDPSLVRRFFAEARAVNLIRQENILEIFDLATTVDGRCFLVMEYLQGHPLAHLTGGPLEPAVAIPVLAQVCDALQAAHRRGVVHRDLKPENIFLVRRGGLENFVKLLDFGVAKLLSPGADETLGSIVGTPEFMAPEQILAGAVDGRADLYSLGVIGYVLATGRLPFRGATVHDTLLGHQELVPESPGALQPSVPKAFSEVILRALQKRPDDRFADAQEMKTALIGALACCPPPRPVQAEAPLPVDAPVSPLPPLPRAPGRPLPGAGRPIPLSTRAGPDGTLPTPLSVTQPVRYSTSYLATAFDEHGRALLRGRCTDLSRGGMFVYSEAPAPELGTRLKVRLDLADSTLELSCEVVRHVPAKDAAVRQMSPGFGVQFVEHHPVARAALNRILSGLPPRARPTPSPAPPADDPLAADVLGRFAARLVSTATPYAVLGLSPDADLPAVRQAARETHLALTPLRHRPLSPRQGEQVHRGLARVEWAGQLLGTAASRAAFDAEHGNFRGVARCLAFGLAPFDAESLRRAFLETHPRAETAGAVHHATARSL